MKVSLITLRYCPLYSLRTGSNACTTVRKHVLPFLDAAFLGGFLYSSSWLLIQLPSPVASLERMCSVFFSLFLLFPCTHNIRCISLPCSVERESFCSTPPRFLKRLLQFVDMIFNITPSVVMQGFNTLFPHFLNPTWRVAAWELKIVKRNLVTFKTWMLYRLCVPFMAS